MSPQGGKCDLSFIESRGDIPRKFAIGRVRNKIKNGGKSFREKKIFNKLLLGLHVVMLMVKALQSDTPSHFLCITTEVKE